MEVDMAHTYQELKEKTVAELRELAKEIQHEAVQGYSQMNKERLLPAVCRALNIDMTEHHVATGIDKAGIKMKIRQLKKERDRALDLHDSHSLKAVRRQLHALTHQIRTHLH
jgi:DNA-binding IclR family transcriptional regulator